MPSSGTCTKWQFFHHGKNLKTSARAQLCSSACANQKCACTQHIVHVHKLQSSEVCLTIDFIKIYIFISIDFIKIYIFIYHFIFFLQPWADPSPCAGGRRGLRDSLAGWGGWTFFFLPLFFFPPWAESFLSLKLCNKILFWKNCQFTKCFLSTVWEAIFKNGKVSLLKTL